MALSDAPQPILIWGNRLVWLTQEPTQPEPAEYYQPENGILFHSQVKPGVEYGVTYYPVIHTWRPEVVVPCPPPQVVPEPTMIIPLLLAGLALGVKRALY
jgi:hypothetical protein